MAEGAHFLHFGVGVCVLSSEGSVSIVLFDGIDDEGWKCFESSADRGMCYA
jgi:hypothetical protein